MNTIFPKITRLTIILSVIIILMVSLNHGSILRIYRPGGAQFPEDEISKTVFIPEILNITLDSFQELNDMKDTTQNLTFIKEGNDGSLRLSTNIPDITITGSFSSGEPIYAETLTLKAGASVIPSGGGDNIEMYARNLVMERGSIIDVTGRGGINDGKGEDGKNADRYWRGGGGGGGGGYGGEGADGGYGGEPVEPEVKEGKTLGNR